MRVLRYREADRLGYGRERGAGYGSTPLNENYFKLLSALVGEVPTMMRWKSKGGVGTHVVLRFEKTTFTPAEAIALEGALGSDLKRVVLYIARLKNGVEQPRVLFKPQPPNPLGWYQRIKEKWENR